VIVVRAFCSMALGRDLYTMFLVKRLLPVCGEGVTDSLEASLPVVGHAHACTLLVGREYISNGTCRL
jgi:hypothetical protein